MEVESPWLSFRAEGKEIRIGSNVSLPQSASASVPESLVTIDEDGVYHVMVMSLEQRVVIDRIKIFQNGLFDLDYSKRIIIFAKNVARYENNT